MGKTLQKEKAQRFLSVKLTASRVAPEAIFGLIEFLADSFGIIISNFIINLYFIANFFLPLKWIECNILIFKEKNSLFGLMNPF